jgi:hypothetical protein
MTTLRQLTRKYRGGGYVSERDARAVANQFVAADPDPNHEYRAEPAEPPPSVLCIWHVVRRYDRDGAGDPVTI